MKKTISLLTVLAMCLSITSCSTAAENTVPNAADEQSSLQTAEKAATETAVLSSDVSAAEESEKSVSEMFTSRDYETGYSDAETVELSSVTGNIEITKAGTYLLKGALENGQIIVNAGDSDKIQLVFDNASVSCQGSAALYIKNADKVFVTTTEGGGKLVSTGEFVQSDENNVDGAVYAKADVTFNGTGTLEISCETAHGIVGKDDIKITSGTYTVTAAKKGIDCNESVRIANGSIGITSGTDGIHSENDNAEKSFVFVSGGKIAINSGNDGIDCTGGITLLGGELDITAYGGSENGAAHYESFGRGFSQGRNDLSVDADSLTSDSYKGIKSDTQILIDGALINADTADDSIHAGTTLSIRSGTLTLLSGDDGIHSDDAVYIYGGSITINKSYEGIEGEIIDISGGDIRVVASDDGMNAAGGETTGMMDTDQNAKLLISGGNISVNADGDGLDSNGYITVSGGVTFVSGPTNSGNGALDSGLGAVITGGTVVAAGATGMAENFGSESTQGSILYTFGGTLSGGTEIVLTDGSGNEIISFAPEKSYQCVVISTPDIVSGGTYNITAGETSGTIEMTSNIYGEGNNFGGFGGGQGGRGGMFGGRDRKNGENGEMPESPQWENGERPEFPQNENGGKRGFRGDRENNNGFAFSGGQPQGTQA